MEYGNCQKNMSNILNDLNLNSDSVNWWDISACSGMDTNLFFDTYESNENVAKNIDQCCLSCPVMKICYDSGVQNNEYGVWGGVYLSSGLIDKIKNSHKTKEIWKKVNKKNGIK